MKTILSFRALRKQAAAWIWPMGLRLPHGYEGLLTNVRLSGSWINLSNASCQHPPEEKAEPVSSCAWILPLPPRCQRLECTSFHRNASPSVLQAWSLGSLGKGDACSPWDLQHSALSPVPRRHSNHISREKKPRNAQKTEHLCTVLKPVTDIVHAYDKIKPSLTSKMNN